MEAAFHFLIECEASCPVFVNIIYYVEEACGSCMRRIPEIEATFLGVSSTVHLIYGNFVGTMKRKCIWDSMVFMYPTIFL